VSSGTGTEGAADTSPLLNGLRVIRERWWVIALSTAVVTAALLALALSGTKQYKATSSLLIRRSELTSLIDPSAQQNVDPAREAATNLLLVRSTAVADRVRVQLGNSATSSALIGQLDATAAPDANLINITVTDPDPRRAAVVANAFAAQFVAFQRDSDRKRATDGAALLRQQLAALPPGPGTQRIELESALQKVNALQAVTTGDAEVIDVAKPPTTASSPLPKRSAAEGLVLGLGLGVAIVFLIDLFDRRVKDIEEFEARYRARTLATIPFRARDPQTQRDRQAALEPFRILRNALGFLGTDGDIRVVLVTSAVAGEGKSTVAAGLARAIALAGQSVVLVEADLRRPTFHKQFDLGSDRRGLTSSLIGGVPVTELLRPVLPGLRTLTVLPSGPVPPNSAELLRSAAMSRVLQELKLEAQFIVLDAPPLLPVADSQVLLDSDHVDACLLVGRAYVTTRDEVRRTRAVLDRHRMRNLGLVVNGTREVDADYDYSGDAESSRPSAYGRTA
jgi:succinoglycan biosynthesis transport protein ExoP